LRDSLPRRGMPSPRLSKVEFRKGCRPEFADPAFSMTEVTEEIERHVRVRVGYQVLPAPSGSRKPMA